MIHAGKKYVSMISFSKSYLLIHLEMTLEAGKIYGTLRGFTAKF